MYTSVFSSGRGYDGTEHYAHAADELVAIEKNRKVVLLDHIRSWPAP